MISLIIILLSIVVAVGWLISTRSNAFGPETKDRYGDVSRPFNPRWLFTPIAIVVVGLITGMIQPYSLERVDAGHIGIKVKLTGNERGVSDYTYKTGWVVYNTWTENLYEFPTFQQHIEYDNQIVITKGGFQATIKPTFNYSLKADAVGDMFSELRLDIKGIEKGWLMTAIVGSVNDVANRWAVDDIFNKREEFESAIVAECNKRVSKWFIVSQLRTNIVPPEALKASIEAKTKAVQDAQAKMQEALVAEADAKKKIAIARGDSAQAVIKASGLAESEIIEARGTAEAMRLKQKELNALYVEFIKAQNWDGKLPTTVLGNSTPMINVK